MLWLVFWCTLGEMTLIHNVRVSGYSANHMGKNALSSPMLTSVISQLSQMNSQLISSHLLTEGWRFDHLGGY